MIRDTRFGKFAISKDIFDKQNYKLLSALFSKVFPVRAELMYCNLSIEYVGVSELFREVKIGEKYPRYEIIANEIVDDDGETVLDYKISAREIEDY